MSDTSLNMTVHDIALIIKYLDHLEQRCEPSAVDHDEIRQLIDKLKSITL